MKNGAYILWIALLGMFAACDDQEQRYDERRAEPTRPIITIEGLTELVIKDGMETNFYGSALTWTRANYGKGIPVLYTMEVSANELFEGTKVSETVGTDIYMKTLSVQQLITWATETFGEQDAETGKWKPVTLFFRIVAGATELEDSETATSLTAKIEVSWYEDKPVTEEFVIGFKAVSVEGKWDEFAVYAWGDNDEKVFGAWPGKVLEPDGEGWYSFTLPVNRPIYLIINNNGGGRQFDFLKNPTEESCFEFVIDGNDNCDWTAVNCPEFEESAMYMIGDEFGEWDWNSDGVVVMNPVNGYKGHFWAIRHITAGKGFKWCAKRAWEGDFNSLGDNSGFTADNGNAVVAADGLYMIYISLPDSKISVEEAKVYGIGDCFGSGDTETYPFTVNDRKMEITTVHSGNLRMYAGSAIAPVGDDWWRMEFNIFDGNIVYRGDYGLQAAVPVDAGKVVTLDFNAGTASIE